MCKVAIKLAHAPKQQRQLHTKEAVVRLHLWQHANLQIHFRSRGESWMDVNLQIYFRSRGELWMDANLQTYFRSRGESWMDEVSMRPHRKDAPDRAL